MKGAIAFLTATVLATVVAIAVVIGPFLVELLSAEGGLLTLLRVLAQQ